MAMALLLLETTDAHAQDATLTITPLRYVVQNPPTTPVFFVTGTYNVAGYGPFERVTVQVRQTDANGVLNPVDYAEVTCTTNGPNTPASGNYNGMAGGPYTAGKRYFIKTYLYNDSNIRIKQSGDWVEVSQ